MSRKETRKETFMGAAAISTIGLIITRVISVVYIIPFNAMMTVKAFNVHNYAYTMFNQFYELSLAGLPLAVARLISMYNAKEQYKTSERVLKYAQRIMLFLGVVLAGIFFLIAKPYANFQFPGNDVEVVADLTRSMRIIAPALIVLPILSGMRGYLQGFMTVFGVSVSQVIERIVFVIFLLAILFVTINTFNLQSQSAISYAFVALPIASLVAVFVLFPFYRKVRLEHAELIKADTVSINTETNQLIKQIIFTALPFVIAGLATTMYSGITAFTFTKIRTFSGVATLIASAEYNIVSTFTNKLVSIPLTFSLALSTSIVSFITNTYEAGNRKGTINYIKQSFRMIIFSTLGAVILMIIFGEPLLHFFYGREGMNAEMLQASIPFDVFKTTTNILRVDGFRGVCLALETIAISILQGVGKKEKAVLFTCTGPIAKLLLQFPLVYFFGLYGEIAATILGLLLSICLSTREIMKTMEMKSKFILVAVTKTLVALLPIVISVSIINHILILTFPIILVNRVAALAYTTVFGLISLVLFLIAVEKIGMLKTIFGKNITLADLFSRYVLRK